MEIGDDYQSLSPPIEDSSPSPRLKKLKRLRKSVNEARQGQPSGVDEVLGLHRVDFARLEALEAGILRGFEDSSEPLLSSQALDEDIELSSGFGGLSFEKEPKEARRALDFDGEMLDDSDGEMLDDSDGERVADHSLGMASDCLYSTEEKIEDKRTGKEELAENNKRGDKRKKKGKSGDETAKPKLTATNMRREEKERSARLQQLHAESQRLLRESRNATFKPVPVVQKSVSSVLEKIRQRKLEVSKRFAFPNSNSSFVKNVSESEVISGSETEEKNVSETNVRNGSDTEKKNVSETEVKIVSETELKNVSEINGMTDLDIGNEAFGKTNIDDVAETMKEVTEHTQCVTDWICATENEGRKESAMELKHDNNEDVFTSSQASDSNNELTSDVRNSPPEEEFAPSILAMNLKFDSSSPDESTSEDEEDDDKENVDPHPHELNNWSLPNGDPAKSFLDDEAEEEEDSDHDLSRFNENEDENESDDFEDLNDMIASGYEENPTDKAKCNELHQKWMEQQDAAGTDKLLQKLKYGSKLVEPTLINEEDEVREDEDVDSEYEEEVPQANPARLNQRKAKQIIAQMFCEKDVAFLSDEDEEIEKRLTKRHNFVQAESSTLLPPAEDEGSREVFGLIKNLTKVPETRKQAKATSFFDSVLIGEGRNYSKSSFLGRASNHSLTTSHKQGSGMTRSFVFGRDDSNGCSSISTSEDSIGRISVDNQTTRISTNKFSSSQVKSHRSLNYTAEMSSGTSLFEVLKQSSVQPTKACNQDNMVSLTRKMFDAFKIPKKPTKMEGRG